jgi:hypothetical protein
MEVPGPRVANPYVFIVGCPRSGTAGWHDPEHGREWRARHCQLERALRVHAQSVPPVRHPWF